MLPNLDGARPIPHDTWKTIIEYGATTNVSTLTTLLAFTDYGSVYRALRIALDNMDTVTFSKDEPTHARVPALRLVTKMDAGLEELLH